MKAMVLLIFSALVAAGCTSADEATRALSGAGYADIKITGYRFFGCGEDDQWRTGFEAKGPNGAKVTGVVCSGVMKGATIRLD